MQKSHKTVCLKVCCTCFNIMSYKVFVPWSFTILVFGYGQIVIDGNIELFATLMIDILVPLGFDKNFIVHLPHCHKTTPKHERKNRVLKTCSVSNFIFWTFAVNFQVRLSTWTCSFIHYHVYSHTCSRYYTKCGSLWDLICLILSIQQFVNNDIERDCEAIP